MNPDYGNECKRLAGISASEGLLSGYDRKFLYSISYYFLKGYSLTSRQKNHLADLISKLRKNGIQTDISLI